MKRLFVVLCVALGAITASATTKADRDNDMISRYDMSVDMRRMGCILGLTLDQMDTMDVLYTRFNSQMREASTAENPETVVESAIKENFRSMRFLLNDKQLAKYEKLITTTLSNRGLLEI